MSRFALTRIVLDAVHAAQAADARYVTLEAARSRAPNVPRAEFDAGLFELEKMGEIKLEPTYNGNSITLAEREAGIVEAGRGLLLFAIPAKRRSRARVARATAQRRTQAAGQTQRGRARAG